MRKTWKKLLAVMLVLSMVLSMTVTAWAVEKPRISNGTAAGKGLKLEDVDPGSLKTPLTGEINEDEDPALVPEHQPDEMVRVSIFLEKPSTMEKGYSADEVTSFGARIYRANLESLQGSVSSKISKTLGRSLDVVWNLTLVANAISANVRYGDIEKIRTVPGVKSVELENLYTVDAGSAADRPNTSITTESMVGATETWANGYTGAGTRIAIIDTGLDDQHQSFDPEAFEYALAEAAEKAGKSVEDYNLLTADEIAAVSGQLHSGADAGRAYLSSKVPYAFNYVDGNYNTNHLNDTQEEHGSHVAGIAAANRYVADGNGGFQDAASSVFAVGVAPDAQLIIMKVFGRGGGAYDSDYMSAIEDAIVLKADSINLSLGSGSAGYSFSAGYQNVMDGLAKSGTVVTMSSGNNSNFSSNLANESYGALFGDDINFHTGGSPGSFINSLGIASADNIGQTGCPVIFNGEQAVFYSETDSTGAKLKTIAGTYDFVYIDGVGEAEEYATVNETVSLAGKVVIVNRGAISFYEKGNNLIPYEPAALMVANNQPGVINMALDDYEGTFPMVSFTLADANTLKAASAQQTVGNYSVYTGTAEIAEGIQAGASGTREDAQLSSFSSWGVPSPLTLKPEITTPGGDIYSVNGAHISRDSGALVGGDNASYESMSGTSMAAPHAAGMAALLAQYIRENDLAEKTGLSARQLAQSLLMSTATPMLDSDGYYVSVLGQGAGLASVAYASQAKSFLTMDENATVSAEDGKVKAELGDDPDRTGSYSYTFTVNNMSDEDLVYELNTDLFTQYLYNGVFLLPDTDFLDADVTYTADEANLHDVDVDGDTDEDDAQAILDKIAGNYPEDAEFDAEAADLDGDGAYTSYDAHLLLKFLEDMQLEDNQLLVPANGSTKVTVDITLTDTDALDETYYNGAYVEGYTYLTCISETEDGERLDVEHSIPILGFYGDWTDATMFDRNSGINAAYGVDYYPAYFENFEGQGGLRVRYPGKSTSVYMINPYVVEDEYPEGRMFINSKTALSGFAYSLIRNAVAVGYTILDESGEILKSGASSASTYADYYYPSQGAWQLSLKNAAIGTTAEQLGLEEGDSFTVGLHAATEYTAMQLSGNTTGSMTQSQLEELVVGGQLGAGASMVLPMTVDDTAPELVSMELSEDKTSLTVTAQDNNYIAAIMLMDISGLETYEVIVPEQSEPGEAVEVTFEGLDAEKMGSGVCVFVGDYARNEAAKFVKLADGPVYDKEVIWVLTDTLEDGQEYVIANSNEPGAAAAVLDQGGDLYYLGTQKGLTISEDENGTYITSDQVESAMVWVANGDANDGFVLVDEGYNAAIAFYNDDNDGGRYVTVTSDHSSDYGIYTLPFIYSNELLLNPDLANYGSYGMAYGGNFDFGEATPVYLYTPVVIEKEIDPEAVSEVIVTPERATLLVGSASTVQLDAEVKPIFAENKDVTWSSSDESVATVDENGLVTAVDLGKAIITATSVLTPEVSGSAEISVVEADYDLNATIWDEQGEVWFASFNPMTMPEFTRLHDTSLNPRICSAAYGADGVLYAATFDGDLEEGVTTLYTVDEDTYELTEVGTCSDVPYFDMCGTYNLGANLLAAVYGPYVLLIDAETGDYVGSFRDRNGVTSGNLVGIAYYYGETNEDYGYVNYLLLLDDQGDLFILPIVLYNGRYTSFGFNDLGMNIGEAVDTPYWQSLYGDEIGNIFWSRFSEAENDVDLMIYDAEQDDVFNVGSFADGVWPVGGLYEQGVVAPVAFDFGSVGGERQSIKLTGEPQVMSTEIQRISGKSIEKVAPISDGGLNRAQEAVAEVNIKTLPVKARTAVKDAATAAEVTENKVVISDDEAITNGTYKVAYDPENLTFVEGASELDHYSIKDDGEGTVTVTFAAAEALEAGTTIATLTFTPSCEDSEVTVTTIERNEETGLEDVGEPITFPGTGHDWGEPEWTWSEDNTSATAKFVCKNVAEHVEEIEATVTKETTEATCTEDGKTVWTATVTGPDGKEYTDTKEETTEATGHDWGEPEWTWAEDFGTATAKFVCKNDETHVEEVTTEPTFKEGEPTCTEDGETVYTATVTGPDGKEYTDTKTQTVPAHGHQYVDDPEWTWAEDYSSATATFTCVYDYTHTVEITTTEIGSKTVNPGCEENGVTVYTATVTSPDGTRTYTDRVEQELPATGHDWNEPTWEWGKDNAIARFVCKNDETHVVEIDVLTDAEEIPATCTEDGKTVYTATVTGPDGKTYTATNEVAGEPALGHDWGEPEWTWSEDNTSATAKFVCKNDPSHVEEIEATVTKETTEPTCEKDGKIVYTATVTGPDGKTYTDTKGGTIPALGHDWGEPTWEWNADKSSATATFVCKNCGKKVVVTAEVTVTTDEDGNKTYTAKVTGPDGKIYTDVITEGVKTGDPVNLGLYFGLLGICAAAAFVLVMARRKRKED